MQVRNLVSLVLLLGWMGWRFSARHTPPSPVVPRTAKPVSASIADLRIDQQMSLAGTLSSSQPSKVLGRSAWLTHKYESSETKMEGKRAVRRKVPQTKELANEIRWGSHLQLKTSDGLLELDTKLLRISRRSAQLQSIETLKDWSDLRAKASKIPSTALEIREAVIPAGSQVVLSGWVRHWAQPVLQVDGEVDVLR